MKKILNMKKKYRTNTLLFIFNINLILLQLVAYIYWTSSLPGGDGNGSEKNADDDVQVYNNINDIMEADVNHVNEDKKDEEPQLGSLGVVHQEKITNITWNWNWDGREGVTSHANRFLYLVRHGQYYGNGPYEKHLSTLGQQQATKVGEKLKSYNITFHRFISSTAIRAVETADFIHRSIPYLSVEYSDELKEGWPTFPDPPTPGQWDKNNPIFKNDIPRLDRAFTKYIHRADPDAHGDSNEIIVCHGNVIAVTVLRALQVAPSRWLKIGVLQASITLLHIQPDGDVALRILGDVGHLNKAEWSG